MRFRLFTKIRSWRQPCWHSHREADQFEARIRLHQSVRRLIDVLDEARLRSVQKQHCSEKKAEDRDDKVKTQRLVVSSSHRRDSDRLE